MATRDQAIRIAWSQGQRLVEAYQRVFLTPHRQQRQAAVVVRQWFVRIGAKRPIKARHRLDQPEKVAQRVAAQDKRIDQKRIEYERPVTASDRILWPPHLAQNAGVV